jgi:putative drug exporter of the RND superfamily
VLIDATVVRMVLVPAAMKLLGDRNWWVPGWLDRILPRFDIEGGTGLPTPEYEEDRVTLTTSTATRRAARGTPGR